MPVTKEAGGKVIGGTLNARGALVMRAEKSGSEAMLARIVQTVADAQRSRAPVQALADRVSAWFVPAVVAVAVVAAYASIVTLVLAGPWMLTVMVDYMRRLFEGIPGMIG